MNKEFLEWFNEIYEEEDHISQDYKLDLEEAYLAGKNSIPVEKPVKPAKPDLETLAKWCNYVKLENKLEGTHYDMQQFWVCTIQDIEVKHPNIYEAVKQCNELAEKQSKVDIENIKQNLPF